jgi:hypothetical protein
MPRQVDGYTVRCKVDEREYECWGGHPISYKVQVKQGAKWCYVGGVYRVLDGEWAGFVKETPETDRLWDLSGWAAESTMRDLLWRLIPAAEEHGLISKGGE